MTPPSRFGSRTSSETLFGWKTHVCQPLHGNTRQGRHCINYMYIYYVRRLTGGDKTEVLELAQNGVQTLARENACGNSINVKSRVFLFLKKRQKRKNVRIVSEAT